MKIRIVSSKDEINTIENEEMVHFAFRPSNMDILTLAKTCPKLKAIHIPNSYNKTISKSTLMFLEMKGIKILEGDVWGHRKDINEYYEIKPHVFDRIEELMNEGKSKEEIISKLGLETRLSEDLIKFLV
ncbi:MAG TPA: DUF1699 family protein [Candidatus Nanoarchaeia archaeon]|nr:DUF1699 family protein [Candidatus Nanoarchaeia archaeon]